MNAPTILPDCQFSQNIFTEIFAPIHGPTPAIIPISTDKNNLSAEPRADSRRAASFFEQVENGKNAHQCAIRLGDKAFGSPGIDHLIQSDPHRIGGLT